MSLQDPIPTAVPTMPQPVQPNERIHTIDVVRGVALLGILMVNMGLFYNSIFDLLLPSAWVSLPDRFVSWFIHLFAEGKFYPVFSFLFGLGFAIQLQRAEERGTRIVPLYARRLLVLLAIGLIHALLIWSGDILVTYALLGFVLLLFRNRHPRTILTWAALLLFVPILLMSVFTGLWMVAASQPETSAMMDEVAVTSVASMEAMANEAARVYSQGTYGEQVGQRVADLLLVYQGSAMQMFPVVMSMFLFGLYAGKRQFFQNIPAHLPLARKIMVWGLVVGLPLNLLLTMTYEAMRAVTLSWTSVLGTIALVLGGPALAFAYIAALTLLMQRESWPQRLAPLAAMGRMALTNYLMQSVICTTVFYSFGLGLFGRIGPAMGLALTVVIYALQLALSLWWLSHYRYGPVEWLWRTLTYGHAQPMRLPPSASGGGKVAHA